MNLEFIDSLSREDCITVIKRARARLRQLRILDPMIYGIKRTFRGETRYHTCVKGMGSRQLLATDLNHSDLWLTSSREWAEQHKEHFEEDHPVGDEVWEVFEIPKVDAINLPCYRRYRDQKEITGETSHLPSGICWFCGANKKNIYGLCSSCFRFGKPDSIIKP